jgi:hypothetical protein
MRGIYCETTIFEDNTILPSERFKVNVQARRFALI